MSLRGVPTGFFLGIAFVALTDSAYTACVICLVLAAICLPMPRKEKQT